MTAITFSITPLSLGLSCGRKSDKKRLDFLGVVLVSTFSHKLYREKEKEAVESKLIKMIILDAIAFFLCFFNLFSYEGKNEMWKTLTGKDTRLGLEPREVYNLSTIVSFLS